MSKVKGSILIVDDNEEVLIALKLYLSKHIENVDTEKNPNRIPEYLRKSDYDVIILDMNFTAGISTGNEGIYWMNEILKSDKSAIIILLTAYGDVELAVKAIKEGATDFIQKPWDNEKMLATILSGIKLKKSSRKIDDLKNKQKHLSQSIDRNYDFYIGSSEKMQQVIETIKKVAKTDANILILGENGSGKELIAREIHHYSDRSLFESELFGSMKGAFTDAKEDKPGRFEIANGGTLFLDEIGNLNMAMQAKILSVIQNKELTRLGATKSISIDTRIISATNSNLNKLISEDKFREDLLYRINTVKIEVPSLRERKEDIPMLAELFLEKYCKKYNKPAFKIYPSALNKLIKYNWPGNVREFEHAIEKAVILSDNDVLTPDDFSFDAILTKAMNGKVEDYNLDVNEKQLIQKALIEYNNNVTLVSNKLGITRATLYRKLKKYDL
jgi:DNA-binding NtrC family response regulator